MSNIKTKLGRYTGYNSGGNTQVGVRSANTPTAVHRPSSTLESSPSTSTLLGAVVVGPGMADMLAAMTQGVALEGARSAENTDPLAATALAECPEFDN